ncbi:MAG: site-specific integrase [Eggerthellaceae bacterium]|nr:site-specific integrase [Eggerthellaceae bacterium]
MQDILAKLEQDLALRGLSDSTRYQYRKRIERYARFVARPLEETGEQDFRGFLLHLIEDEGLAASTVNCYSAAIVFLYEAVLGRQVDRRQVPRMKRRSRLPEVPTRAEARAIINAPKNPKHKAMISLAYSAGLRVSEIAALRVADIDSAGMRILVRGGKGGKDRYTLLSQECLKALRDYYRRFRPDHPDGWLFPGVCSPGHIKRGPVEDAFTAALARSGVKKRMGIHAMRHAFGTHLYEDGVSLLDIKELLGHASLASTMVYVHLANVAGRVTSPLDVPLGGPGA